MKVRMLRGAVVGPGGLTARPGDCVEVSDSLGWLLINSGKAVVAPEGPEPTPPQVLDTREPIVEQRDPARRRR
jgi:hypothetical protein